MRSDRSGLPLRPWGLAVLLAIGLGTFLGTGCSSTKTAKSAHFASVEIRGQPPERVSDVTSEVFHDHGYKVTRRTWASLCFEKEGTAMNNLAYGNWMGQRVWVRVRVSVGEALPGTCQLKCEAFFLRNRGEPLEEEIRIGKLHKGQYQELLNEVATRISGKTAEPK
ncbi:MAG TPA: hypothetical protein P5205_18380 [Candidatus Paceibacterota bacterium]|nr:hypothetical protein [Verrucomicrobiota bacterium]HSA12330.1 hypothetical protein [Candidatus Paceibacterota bacterium]